ncbi:MAG TPA: GAF domain-containing protein, partial [Candidatus Udaeobacter sp.]|nr:GAF domain-containing protein [Candidatus Udaeobacter sp.]
MASLRGNLAFRIGFTAAAAVLILIGASLNASGRVGWPVAFAGVAGVLALGTGVFARTYRLGLPLGGAALIISLLLAQFNPRQGDYVVQLAGLILLGIGGFVAGIAYRSFAVALQGQVREINILNTQLQQKHRAFLAATSDLERSGEQGDLASLTSNIARQVGADFACCYLESADHRQFVPQPPGVGLDRLHPMPVTRHEKSQLATAVGAGQTWVADGPAGLRELFNYVPDDLRVERVLAVPMPIGDRVAGFLLLGSKAGGFSDDDRRLATTLTLRAGAQLASAHAV